MAKTQVDSFVAALIDIKSMISNLKLLSNIIAFDPDSSLVYMVPQADIHDCFTIIDDPDISESSKKFTYHIINTVEAVSFNKALKKTKTISDISDDKSIIFTTEGYNESLTMIPIIDYKDVTKSYKRLFKDADLTKSALSTISPNYEDWFKINDNDFNRLKNNELVIIESITGNQIYISKSLFGNIKKTEAIYHTVIQHNDSDEVVLFKQVESGYSIYHIIRFLNMI